MLNNAANKSLHLTAIPLRSIAAGELCRYGTKKEEDTMEITANGWSNKGGTAVRNCSCGSWKQHWLNFSFEPWPTTCSVAGCNNRPVLGAHIKNPNVTGEKIVPMCDSCNQLTSTFDLKGGVTLVSANTSETCEK